MRALARSAHAPSCSARPATPGSPPTPSACPRSRADDVEAIVAAATERRVDLVVVGPEAALVAGVVDALEEAGVPAFGPSAAAAELEGSKAFAKELMKEAGVPTAAHVLLRSREEAVEHLACASYPAVLKADGLAAGKGVIICATEAEARDAVDVFFTERRFGETDGRARGVPRGRGALAAGALRRRERRAAGAGPGLQADLRRRRGPEHRRHGQLLAGARLRRRPRSRRSSTPSTGRSSPRWRGAGAPSTASSTPA